MTMSSSRHHGVSVDLPHVSHPSLNAGRTPGRCDADHDPRDGKVYLGNDRIWSDDLAQKIQNRLKDREVERKVYVVADTRARWGVVKAALDEVRSAGIIRVAFLVDQRRVPVLTITTPSGHSSKLGAAEAAVLTPVCQLRISRPVLDPDRRSYKSEGFADLVFEKALVGKVQLDGAVGEQHERGRRDRSLRHV